MFSTLQSLLDLEGSTVLDLYAGSGALALEAVSRGAAAATVVENDPAALRALEKNVAAFDAPVTVVDADVEAFLAREPSPYELVVLDPPYETDVEPVLELLRPWLAEGAIVVVERRTKGPEPTGPDSLVHDRSRRYGEATLWYFRAAPTSRVT
jgi:16S rRNA (guanine966-N2)-methyltransferase